MNNIVSFFVDIFIFLLVPGIPLLIAYSLFKLRKYLEKKYPSIYNSEKFSFKNKQEDANFVIIMLLILIFVSLNR